MKSKNTKKFWVRKIFALRKEKGEFDSLVREMRLHDREFFFKMFRMNPIQLGELTRLVGRSAEKIAHQYAYLRHQLHPDWSGFLFASEIREKLNSFQLFCEENSFRRELAKC